MNHRTLLALGMAVAIAAGCTDDMTEPSHGASVQIAQGTAVRAVPGDTVHLSVSVLDDQGQPVPGAMVRWTSADPTVARVDASGLVVAVAFGSTTVTATATSGASADLILIVTIGPIREVDDRAVLTALYEATDGPNWTENEGWLTDAPLEDWYGIATDDQGRVVYIDLADNGLTGEIPSELGDLTGLVGLYLSYNDLTGGIPAELGNLANLEWLQANNNALTSEIPAELGGLASLESLSLGENGLTGGIPAELGTLAKLRGLGLSSNYLTGQIPAELGNLASLEHLGLNRNYLTGQIPAELANLTSLRGVNLRDNGLTGEIPAELGNLASLAWLNLGDNDLTGGIPAELGKLANLRSLILRRNDLTGEIPVELGDLANLEVLWLNGNRLTGTLPMELAGLANLRQFAWECGLGGLCAPGTQDFMDFAEGIGYEGPFCHEADAAVLESLYSSASGSTWSLSDGWLQPGPLSDWHGVETDSVGRVTVLELSGNGLSGALPASLSLLKALRELRVEDNSGLGGRFPLAMTALSLQVLQYGGTSLCIPDEPSFRGWLQSIASRTGSSAECPPLTDRDGLEFLYHFAGGPNWETKDNWLTAAPLEVWYGVQTDDQGRVINLSLGGNGLTGGIPAELGDLSSLEWLALSENGLTGEIPAELGNLASLGLLNLEHNGLTGKVPPELGDLANLRELWLGDNGLTGGIPPELGDLANLEWLGLSGNGLTGEIPAELGNLASLGLLNLEHNGLNGKMPPELGDLAKLRELWLGDNDLTGGIPVELGGLANLERLNLSNNSLTGEIPAELGDLANLRGLWLEGNGLTGGIPAELADLAKLERLNLAHNAGMSGTLPAAWTSLDMSELQLGGTGLCAPSDAAFQSWLKSILFRHVSVCAERADGEARTAAYVVQAIQSFEFPVPLVAGRPGLLRVFASVPQVGGARMPAARATFYQRDGSERVLKVPSGNGTLTAELQEESLGGSANVEVPGDVLRPGVEMVVEVDPAGTLDPGLGVPVRIPATGRTALEVYELPPFDVTVVPFLWEADPDSSILDMTRGMTPDDSLFEETRKLLPVGAMSVTVHQPVWSSSNSMFDLLSETEAIRTMESGSGYWMGTMPEAGGVAFVPGRSQFSGPFPSTIAHEFGHNMHLWHAPCGGAGGPDPAYPNRAGRIGAWGWDRRLERLVPPARPDLMSYCGPEWVGDYHFGRSFRWRMHHEAGVAAFQGSPTRVLLLWGGADADGQPFLNPSFVVDDARASLPDGAGQWHIAGEAEDGRTLFDRRFDMAEIADGDGRQSFVFTFPTEASWADALARIVLTGPGGTAELDATSGPAAVLLLGPATGRVRGILRDWPDSAVAQPDAAAATPEPGLEIQVSRGVPAPDAWRR